MPFSKEFLERRGLARCGEGIGGTLIKPRTFKVSGGSGSIVDEHQDRSSSVRAGGGGWLPCLPMEGDSHPGSGDSFIFLLCKLQ